MATAAVPGNSSRQSPAVNPRKHICGICRKGFKSKAAQKQHRKDAHTHPNTTEIYRAPRANVPPSPPREERITHRNITYTSLSAAQQVTVLRKLLALSHSEKRLLKEGYSLPGSDQSQNGSRSTPEPGLPFPDLNPSIRKYAAIVLDCEMAGAVGGQNELIQITIIEFLSGRVLLNRLVNPSRPIKNWREDITGINAAKMQEAVDRGEALRGWEGARAELWQFADKNTVLIGQSVQKDLRVLHTWHAKIVDSAIITADAVLGKTSKIKKRWGLEAVCHELLGIQIRKPCHDDVHGVHDALEDALAAREVILLCVREPQKLKHWATVARVTFFNGGSNKPKPPQAGSSQPKSMPRRNPTVWQDDDDELLRWEDVIDWEMWPKSPPDSD